MMDRTELRDALETAVTPGLALESVNAGKDDLLALLDAAERADRATELLRDGLNTIWGLDPRYYAWGQDARAFLAEVDRAE